MLHCRTCVATALVFDPSLGPPVITNVIQSECHWPLPGNEQRLYRLAAAVSGPVCVLIRILERAEPGNDPGHG
jgi:hypothetical protein